jgi:hypothetical protein
MATNPINTTKPFNIDPNATFTFNSISTGNISLDGHIIPEANITYDLGSATNRFRDLYLSGNTIDLAGASIKSDATTGAVIIVPTMSIDTPDPTAFVISPQGGVTTLTTSGGNITFNQLTTALETTTNIGSSYTVKSDRFTGNGSNVSFTLSSTPSDANLLIVNLQGVYQHHSEFTVSGSIITFTEAPSDGAIIEVRNFVPGAPDSLNGILDTFTGDGVETDFTLSTSEGYGNVYHFISIDGVLQSFSDFDINGSTLTFNTAPVNNADIEVLSFVTTDAYYIYSFYTNKITNGTTKTYELVFLPTNLDSMILVQGGVLQTNQDFTIYSNLLKLLGPVPTSDININIVSLVDR